MIYTGNTLKLNVAVAKGGSVRVGLLDDGGRAVRGRGVNDCIPITGDHISTVVRWRGKGGSDVALRAGKARRLQVQMKDARLYTFQFTAGDAP